MDKTVLKPDIINAVVNELGGKHHDLSNGDHGDTKIVNGVVKHVPDIPNKHLFDQHLHNLLLKDKAKSKGVIIQTSESNQDKHLAHSTYVVTTGKPTMENVLVNKLNRNAGVKKLKSKNRTKQLKRRLNKIKRKNKMNNVKAQLIKKSRKQNKIGETIKIGIKRTPGFRKQIKIGKKNKSGKRTPGKRLKWILRRKFKGKKQRKTKPSKQLRFLKRRKGKQNKKKPRRKFLRLWLRKRLQNGKKIKGDKTKDKTGKPLKKQTRAMKGRRWILRLRKRLQKAIGKKPKSIKSKQIAKDGTGTSAKKQGRKLNDKKARRKWSRIKLLRLLKVGGKKGKTTKILKRLGNKRLQKWLRLLQNRRKRPVLQGKLSKKLKKPGKGIRNEEIKIKTETKLTKSSVNPTDTDNAKA